MNKEEVKSRLREILESKFEADKESLTALLDSDSLDSLDSKIDEAHVDRELVSQIKSLIARLKRLIGEVVSRDDSDAPNRGAANANEAVVEIELQSRDIAETAVIEAANSTGDGLTWEVVVLQQGMNKSGIREYTHNALTSAAKIINESKPNIPAFANHPSTVEENTRPERSIGDVVGYYHDARVVGESLKAKLTLWSAEASPVPWLPKQLIEAKEKGNPQALGISIRGNGRTEPVRENSGKNYYRVHEITQLSSADIVTRPGAGGRFISLVEAEQEEKDKEDMKSMDAKEILKTISVEDLKSSRPDLVEALTKKDEGEQKPVTESKPDVEAKITEVKPMDENVVKSHIDEAMKEFRVANAQTYLSNRLREAADLPEIVKSRIKTQFSGKDFKTEELDRVVDEESKLIKSLREEFAPKPIRQYADLTNGESQTEKWQKAFEGMLLGEDVDKVRRFRGLKEAYGLISGKTGYDILDPGLADEIFYGMKEAYRDDPRIQEAEVSTSTFTNIFGTSMKKVLLKRYHDLALLADWKKVVSDITSVTDFKTNDRLTMGGYGLLTAVGEGSAYPEGGTLSEERVQWSPSKYGFTVPLTFEAIANDDLGSLRRIPRLMADSAAETLHRFVFDFMDNNSNYDADSTALIASGHNNHTTTALSASVLMTAIQQLRAQTGASGSVLTRVRPAWLVVPPELEDLGWRLLNQDRMVQTSSFTATEDNVVKGRYNIGLIVVDYWTDATDWFLVADPRSVPTIEVGFWRGQEEPELLVQDDPTVGANFSADKITWKMRHIYGGDILDYRGFAGGIVA